MLHARVCCFEGSISVALGMGQMLNFEFIYILKQHGSGAQINVTWETSVLFFFFITMYCWTQKRMGNCEKSWMLEGDYCAISCNRCVCNTDVSKPGCDECSDTPPADEFTCEEQVSFVLYLIVAREIGELLNLKNSFIQQL